MTPEPLQDIEPQPKGMSEVSRLTGVFFEPGKAFADIAARPSYWVPLLLSILVGIAFTTAISSRIGFDRVIDQQVQSRMAEMSADQQAQAQKGVEMQKKFAPVGSYVIAVIGPVIGGLCAAGVLLLMLAILSAPLKFKQVFAIWFYSAMPILVFYLLAIMVMYIKSPDDFNIRNPLMFNPGAFLEPGKPSKFINSILSALDLFVLWRIWVLATGLKVAAGKKLSMGGALAAVVLPWSLMVLIGAAFAGFVG